MRSRLQEWVIILGIVAIGVTGVLTLWGKDLFYSDEKAPADKAAENAPSAAKVVPGGPSQGPF